jgi:integrase
VDELTAAEIQMFINGMVENNASCSLLKKAVIHLRAILELARDLDIIKTNPMRRPAVEFEWRSQKTQSDRCLSLDECRALLAELSGRDRLIVRMFIQLGLRPEELFALRRNDVDHEFIRIDEVFSRRQRLSLKPAMSPTNVYLPPGLLQELRTWMATTSGNESDWLFPTLRQRRPGGSFPVNQNTFRRRVLRPAAEKAGISHVDLRTLRRTCAKHFWQEASADDAQAQLRLSRQRTIAPHSRQLHSESLKRVAAALEAEMFAGPGLCLSSPW